MGRAYSEQDETPKFWFNLKTRKVEIGPQSLSQDRIGPFLTEEDARNALQTIADREAALIQEEQEDW
jgi:hypothetical protein